MKNTFGNFIRQKRTEKQISLRYFSKLCGISAVYESNIENGARNAPSHDILIKMARVLVLSDDEKELMFELAAQTKALPALASDLVSYIDENDNAHLALRAANRCKANDEDWQMFIDYLSEKYDYNCNKAV